MPAHKRWLVHKSLIEELRIIGGRRIELAGRRARPVAGGATRR
jgi:hypothetical protein